MGFFQKRSDRLLEILTGNVHRGDQVMQPSVNLKDGVYFRISQRFLKLNQLNYKVGG